MAEVTAFRNNALPYPVYGVPWAVTFPMLDADGDLVTGATTPDAERSLNGDTFADCTNESVEIATNSGVYYLLLTAAEMTADIVTVIAKSATAGMKTTVLTLYPRKLVSLRAATAAGGAAGSITLDASASAVDDFFNGCLVVGVLDSTTEARIITDYAGSTKVASVTPNWNTTPDSDDTFTIYLPEGRQLNQANVTHVAETAQTAGDLKASLNTIDDFLDTEVAAIITTLGAPAGASLAADIAAIEAQTDDIGVAGAGLTAIPWNAAWDAEVQSECTDALNAYDPPTNAEMEARTIAAANYATASALDAVDNFLDTEIAAILADTNELQTDWADGGRLDLILDARASASALDAVDNFIDTEIGAIISTLGTPAGASLAADIAAIEAQTDDIGTAGAGLTAVPWNAAWDAEVQSEVADGLADVGLTTTITGRIDAAVSTRATPAQVNTEADTALADVGLTTTVTGRIDAAVSTRATPAQVNTEVLDVLTVDTFAEASAVPAATSTLKDKLNWLFALARNRLTQSATTQTVYADDASTPVATSAVSDSGTEAVRAEWS